MSCANKYSCGCVNLTCKCPPLPELGSVWRCKDGLGGEREVTRVVGQYVYWRGTTPRGVVYESGSMPIKLWTQHLYPVQMSVTVTGRAASQPELQPLPAPGPWKPDAGSRWVHKKRDRHIAVVGVGKSTLCPRESWVKYTVVGSRRRGQIPLASFLDSYAPAPMSQGVVDFCGLEARVAALHCAKPAFDLHRLRAAQIFDVKPSEVTDAQRKVGKSANFLDTYR